MLGLGLQATVTNEGGGIAKKQPVKDGLVMYHQYQDFPTDSLRLSFPAEGSGEFNGTSDYIDTGAVLIDGPHTIAAWVYYEGSTGAQVVDSRDGSQDGVYFYITNLGQFYYRVNASTIPNTNQYKNQWVYAVGTYDNSTQKLYVNGSLLQFANLSSAIIDVTNTTKIGRNSYAGAEYFDGNLANVAIWNRALTSDEINTVMWASYDQLPTSIKVGLQAWYALDSQPVSAALYTEYVESQGGTVQDEAYVQQQLNALSV